MKIFDSQKHRQYVGVGNGLILENLRKLFDIGAKIWIRIPVISGVNDSLEEMQKNKEFLSACGIPQKIELLPYHAMGENKYGAIGREARNFRTPSRETMDLLKSVLNSFACCSN